MSLAIAGMGWVTPLGTAIDLVWERLIAGEEASATTISEEFACRSYAVFRAPESALKHVAHARLRRGLLDDDQLREAWQQKDAVLLELLVADARQRLEDALDIFSRHSARMLVRN